MPGEGLEPTHLLRAEDFKFVVLLAKVSLDSASQETFCRRLFIIRETE